VNIADYQSKSPVGGGFRGEGLLLFLFVGFVPSLSDIPTSDCRNRDLGSGTGGLCEYR